MTRLIEFLIALGIVAVLALVVGLVLPSHRHISESVETNRKMTIAYDTVNNLRRFKDWNPLALRDPRIQLNVTGAESGVGARLDYASNEAHVGKGSWEIVESIPNEKVVIKVEDERRGNDKTMQFLLEPTGKNNRNVKITQTYDVDYGWNLLGRYAGLYVSRHVGDDVKLGLSRMANMLATVPNFDYRAEGVPLTGLKVVDVPALDLLVVNAGNIDRNNDAIKQSIKNNQEWIKRTPGGQPGSRGRRSGAHRHHRLRRREVRVRRRRAGPPQGSAGSAGSARWRGQGSAGRHPGRERRRAAGRRRRAAEGQRAGRRPGRVHPHRAASRRVRLVHRLHGRAGRGPQRAACLGADQRL